MTIPDFETATLDRLALCNAEIIGGPVHVWRLPPTYAKDIGEYPMVYAMPGRMAEPIPNSGGSGGQVVVVRDYVISIFIAPTAPMDELQARKGAAALDKASTYPARFRTYYMTNHPDLSTDGRYTAAQDGFSLARAPRYSDGGLVANLVGPGGTTWSGIIVTLTLAQRGDIDMSY